MKYFYSLACISLLAFTSCSKDKRIERSLYKSDGVWNVSSVAYNYLFMDDSGVNTTFSGSTESQGTFSFQEDGKGSYNFTLPDDAGGNHSQNFTWSVEDENIFVAYQNQVVSFAPPSSTQTIVSLQGTRTDKTHMQLTGTESIQYSDDSYGSQKTLTVTAVLSKN